MFYKTDLNDDSNMHWCISEDGHIQMIPMTAVSQDVVVEEYNHHTNLSHVVVLLASPRFPNAALHIYECGQDHTFKIFRVKLRRTVNRRNLILGEINFAYYYQ